MNKRGVEPVTVALIIVAVVFAIGAFSGRIGFDNDVEFSPAGVDVGTGRLPPATHLEGGEKPECNDGIDNDRDGFVDWPDDSDCSLKNDRTEDFYEICTVRDLDRVREDLSGEYVQKCNINLDIFSGGIIDGCGYLSQEVKDKIIELQDSGESVTLVENKDTFRDNFVVVPGDLDDDGNVLEVTRITNLSGQHHTDDEVIFEDAISGIEYSLIIEEEGSGFFFIGSVRYEVRYFGPASIPSEERYVKIDFPNTVGNEQMAFYCSGINSIESIGDNDNPFTGVYDGRNLKISNFQHEVLREEFMSIGLFGASSGTIKNINLDNVYIIDTEESNSVAGLVGRNNGGEVINSYVGGSITSSRSSIGCLVGINQGGSIVDSNSDCSVTGDSAVGGLVGWNNQQGIIENSYSDSDVSGNGDVGCLVGLNSGGNIIDSNGACSITGASRVGGLVGGNSQQGIIENSYSDSDVSGEVNVGGLVGQNLDSLINNSYSISDVGNGNSVGGLVGNNDGDIFNSYSEAFVFGTSSIGGLVGNNEGSITSSHSSGSLESGGHFIGGLVGENDGVITDSYFEGSVNEETLGTFNVGGLVGQNYGDIIGSYSSGIVHGESFVGGLAGGSNIGKIENSYSESSVNGDIVATGGLVGVYGADIGSAMIKDSYATGHVQGENLVGGLIGAVVINSRNDMVVGSYATGNAVGDDDVGGLVGQIFGPATFVDSYSTGTVVGRGATGGFAGNFLIGKIIGSHSSGDVFGTGNVGGLVGFTGTQAMINDSYSTSRTEGNNVIGGLVGWNNGEIIISYSSGEVIGGNDDSGGLVGLNDGSVLQSYSTSSVMGNDEVGGLVGRNRGGVITEAYSIGLVDGDSNVGGLVGVQPGGQTIRSYWNVETSNQTESDGGEGRTTENMTSVPRPFNTYLDWAFEDCEECEPPFVWVQVDGDYPFLLWEI